MQCGVSSYRRPRIVHTRRVQRSSSPHVEQGESVRSIHHLLSEPLAPSGFPTRMAPPCAVLHCMCVYQIFSSLALLSFRVLNLPVYFLFLLYGPPYNPPFSSTIRPYSSAIQYDHTVRPRQNGQTVVLTYRLCITETVRVHDRHGVGMHSYVGFPLRAPPKDPSALCDSYRTPDCAHCKCNSISKCVLLAEPLASHCRIF